jgi:hypothetical protein
MDSSKIVTYLIDDLKKSVINDIGPCRSPDKTEGGYFAVPRLVLSYVDYLGVLYHGYEGRRDKKTNKRILSDGKYAKDFLKEVFGSIDSDYKSHGDLLWEIYRNGAIHLYSPKVLRDKISGSIIGWITYKGGKVGILPDETPVIHLRPQFLNDNTWALPLSIDCIYYDLISAIEKYAGLMPKTAILEEHFRQSANALVEPEETSNLKWW